MYGVLTRPRPTPQEMTARITALTRITTARSADAARAAPRLEQTCIFGYHERAATAAAPRTLAPSALAGSGARYRFFSRIPCLCVSTTHAAGLGAGATTPLECSGGVAFVYAGVRRELTWPHGPSMRRLDRHPPCP